MDGRSNAVGGGGNNDLYTRVDFSITNVRQFTVPVGLSNKEFVLTCADFNTLNKPSTSISSYGTVCLAGRGTGDIIESVVSERSIQNRKFTGQVSSGSGSTSFTLEAWFFHAGDLTLFYREM